MRLAGSLLLLMCQLPPLGRLHWLPAMGTLALLALRYCPMVRFLLVMTWNRVEPLNFD